MKKLILPLAFLPLLMLGFIACDSDSNAPNNVMTPTDAARVAVVSSTNSDCVPLIAGQNINAGSVCFEQMADQLKVTFTVTDDWYIQEAQLWIGDNPNGYPKTRNGNPVPGQFPFASGSINTQTFVFYVPFSWLNYTGSNECYYVMAHASIQRALGTTPETWQGETAWGEGDRVVQRGSWAMRFELCLSDDFDPDIEPEPDSETAFAYGGNYATCFLDDGFNRWGWTNGPLPTGNYTFGLWAGAAQCDVSKGTLVGTVAVNYSNGNAGVTYTVNAPYLLQEVHFYAGSTPYPLLNSQPTVAPGQYPYVQTNLSTASHAFNYGGLSGDIHVIAHAVVSGF
jgi:hypothetical protein